MQISVDIPNGKVDDLIAAVNNGPAPAIDLPDKATADQAKAAVTAHFSKKWKGELRDTLRQARRQARIQAAIEADQADSDPLP